MASDQTNRSTPRRRVSHAALACFAISTIAFIASALGFLVNQALTGSLAISGTAAIGLIFLAMGLLNLGHEAELVEVIVRTRADARDRVDAAVGDRCPQDPAADSRSVPDRHATLSS